MCRQVSCRKCGKATWSGCGQHVDQVMRGVPKAQRCTCGQAKASAPKASTPAEPSSSGFFSRLLGR
jgi:hypothetical protein